MYIKLIPTLFMTLVAGPLAAQAAPQTPPPPFKPFTAAENERYLARGKQIMAWYLAGHTDSVHSAFAPEVQEKIDLDGVRQQRDVFEERAGMVVNVRAEKMTRRQGVAQFWWEADVTNFTAEPVVMRWLLNEELQVVGIGFTPKSRALSDPEG